MDACNVACGAILNEGLKGQTVSWVCPIVSDPSFDNAFMPPPTQEPLFQQKWGISPNCKQQPGALFKPPSNPPRPLILSRPADRRTFSFPTPNPNPSPTLHQTSLSCTLPSALGMSPFKQPPTPTTPCPPSPAATPCLPPRRESRPAVPAATWCWGGAPTCCPWSGPAGPTPPAGETRGASGGRPLKPGGHTTLKMKASQGGTRRQTHGGFHNIIHHKGCKWVCKCV